MDKTIYHLSGSTDELIKQLHNQFGMDENAARLFVFLSLSEKKSDIPEINDDKTALWYMNEEEKYTAPIFRTRFFISFSQLKIDLVILLAEVITTSFFKEYTSIPVTIVSALIALFHSTTHIKDQECCVYFQALDWQMKHPSAERFDVEDIIPKAEEGVCLRLESIKAGKWKCDYYHEEICEVTKERYKDILDSLCKKNIFDNQNNLYTFKH